MQGGESGGSLSHEETMGKVATESVGATLAQQSQYIGRVIFSKDRPARPEEFWCWLADSPNLDVQVGSLLAIDGEQERIIGIVENMQYESAADSTTEFYGSGFGNPHISFQTRPTVLRFAKIRILVREPPIRTPPGDRWKVRYATFNDADTISGHIPPQNRILMGFIQVGQSSSIDDRWCPIYYNSELLLGMEAAHVNITGVTGMATKTSYALFLCYSIMAWAKNNNQRVAIVLFNVKREDFLRLHQLPSNWEQAHQWLEQWTKKAGNPSITNIERALWGAARRVGVDPIALKVPVQYFTFQGDPYDQLMTRPNIYRYGLADLKPEEVIAALYRPGEDVAEQQLNLIHTYIHTQNRPPSFLKMLNDLRNWSLQQAGARPTQTTQQVQWHRETLEAVIRRLQGLQYRASQIIEWTKPNGRPITFQSLTPGFNVIQLYGLSEDAKKLVVNAVIRHIRDGLQQAQKHVDRVVVVVDELNVYAPPSRSPIKDQILDVVARGRDLGLTLIGAEQFASEIDESILGNSNTRVVGRSDTGEVADIKVYRFLGGFRDVAPILQKGQMLVYHPAHTSAVIIHFPVPLHKMIPNVHS